MNLLVKTDPELGYAFFCPACKYHTVGGDTCLFCGEPLEWDTFEEGFGAAPLYQGRVKWPTAEEIYAAYSPNNPFRKRHLTEKEGRAP